MQLENLSYKSILGRDKKERKIRDYSTLEPVITLVWMAEDMLGFTEDYVSYLLTPDMVATFIKSDILWKNPDIQFILQERSKVLEVLNNQTDERPR